MQGETQGYIHGASQEEQQRLESQAQLLGGAEFLPPVAPGMRLLEVGCGTGAILREVALRVDPGLALGLDREEAQLQTARELAVTEKAKSLDFLKGDAAALPFGHGTLDAAFCRFLLEHLADPAPAVAELARVTRPGGWVCALEWEPDCFVNYPDSPAIRRVWQAIYRWQHIRGGDPWVARKLYGAFTAAGLGKVVVEGHAWTITAQEQEKLASYVDGARTIIREAAGGLLAEGLVAQEDLDAAEGDYSRLLVNPESFVLHAFCRALGWKE